MTLSEIRKNARESLTGKWGTAALLMLVYSLIEFGISIIYTVLSYIPLMSLIAYAGLITISIPISFGLAICFIEIKRGNHVECIDYFKFGFSNFKKYWCVTGNILKKIWLYLLLYFVLIFATVFIAIFLTAFSVAMESTFIALFGCLLIFILLAAFIAVAVLLVIKSYLYVLAPYIAWDNQDMSAKDIVEKSEELMKGHRGEYFLLCLSFIGWILLSIFTLGIGLLWIIPYMEIAIVVFYENRLKESGENIPSTNNTVSSGNEPEKLEESTVETKDSEVEEKNTQSPNETVTEVKEEDIEKIDILDDDGNIIE